MRKLLLSSIVLFLFSASIMMFQISCQKQANARTATGSNLVIFGKTNGSNVDIWYCNPDGTGMQKVNIASSFNKIYRVTETPIDNKIFFTARETSGVEPNLFSCELDGSNVRKLTNDTTESVWLGSW